MSRAVLNIKGLQNREVMEVIGFRSDPVWDQIVKVKNALGRTVELPTAWVIVDPNKENKNE